MSLRWIFLILVFTLSTDVASAAKYRRLVNFEWEVIEGAKTYEIELTQVPDESENSKEKPKVFNFKVTSASWNGRLTPGKYIMKLRSKDYRGVPGEWSPPSDFNVGLDNVPLKSPAPNDNIKTKEPLKTTVDFSWDPVGGADQYQFTLNSDDGEIQVSETVADTKKKVELPVAAAYTWKVTALNSEGLQSDAISVGQFKIHGKELETPKLEKPETEFVRQIKWTRPEHVTGFDVMIIRQNPKTKKYEKFKSVLNTQEDTLDFDSTWPGGNYKVAVRAKGGDLRPESQVAKQTFRVRNGDRSPAAEYTALVRKSIDRVTGWYAVASYLITEIKFEGTNPEKNSAVAYNAMGGTGRLGLGWFSPRTSWGFLGILDMSGFTFNGKTQTYASAELNAIHRLSMGDRSELRTQMGPYFKELPETVGDPFSGQSEDRKISSAGAHVGAELWYSLSPKFGIQLNAHLYTSLMKISTPNGQALAPSLSTQFGFLGSYRFTPTFTGLVGYAMREDKMSYKAVPTTDNFATDGDVNESTIVGNYLNFFAEWAF